MFSVSEVAKKLGLSTTAVYQKIKSDPFKDLVITDNGRTMIDDDLFKLLESSFKPKVEHPPKVEINFDKVLDTLTRQLESYENQLRVKDETILSMQRQIDELISLNVNQQTLHLRLQQSQDEIKQIEAPKKHWWQRQR